MGEAKNKPAQQKLIMKDEHREFFTANGNNEEVITHFVDQAQREGSSQAELDARVDEIIAASNKAKAEHEAYVAEAKAANDKARYEARLDAFAGMALQSLIAAPELELSAKQYAAQAVHYAEALIEAIDEKTKDN